ncbi:hypothetical protein BJ742DRAFT_776885 [Cladochytrium replicatum]|nr:hypothetical protein BJ742DRAFT_776885 [Cladochytrium replicatum]
MNQALQAGIGGFFIGIFFIFSRFDAAWWPYLFLDTAALPSKVTAKQRTESIAFYNSLDFTGYPFWQRWGPHAAAAVFVLAAVGNIVQQKVLVKKILHGLSILAIVLGVVAQYFYALPSRERLASKRTKMADQALALRDLALANLAFVFSVILALGLVNGASEDDDDVPAPKKAEKVPAKPLPAKPKAQ